MWWFCNGSKSVGLQFSRTALGITAVDPIGAGISRVLPRLSRGVQGIVQDYSNGSKSRSMRCIGYVSVRVFNDFGIFEHVGPNAPGVILRSGKIMSGIVISSNGRAGLSSPPRSEHGPSATSTTRIQIHYRCVDSIGGFPSRNTTAISSIKLLLLNMQRMEP